MGGIKLLAMINFLDKHAFRSLKQLVIHACVAVGVAVLFYFLLINKVSINAENFVTIMSSITIAAGALLAVSVAFATFMGRYMTDWRERLFERLRQELGKLELQMKMSAQRYPEISRRLTELYLMAAHYIPGQAIDVDEVYEADKIFHGWAKEHAEKSNKQFDFGDLGTYDSFEKHLFDAHLRSTAVRQTLIELHVAEVCGRPLTTFPSLIAAWTIILIFSLLSFIIGSTGIIYESLNIPIIIALAYLAILAIFALIKDAEGSLRIMRILETGHEQAMLELVSKSGSDVKS